MNSRRALARPARGSRRDAGRIGMCFLRRLAAPLIATLAGALAFALAGAPPARAADEVVIPEAHGYVNDTAGVLSEETRAKLESFLDQVQRKTGAEFAVLTVASSAPLDPSDYKVRVFERWKLGKKGKDNGLLMLVSIQEHAVRFETGYGLEGPLPDGLESRIVRERMVPRLRAGDVDGAVTAGVLAAAQRIAAEKHVTLEWNGSELRYSDDDRPSGIPRWALALALFAAISMLRFALMGARYGRRGGWWIGPGGFGGGFGGFGGGGMGGGGGSFGGFGGGSSGGGGGGGNW